MKNLKHVKTFENFKVNEEVPYNFDKASDINKVKWTKKENRTLLKLGADSIGENDAIFKEEDFTATVWKNDAYSIYDRYRVESDRKLDYIYTSNGSNDWEIFLEKFDIFMRNGGRNTQEITSEEIKKEMEIQRKYSMGYNPPNPPGRSPEYLANMGKSKWF